MGTKIMKLEVGKTYVRRDGGFETVQDINIKGYYEVRALSDKHYTKDHYVVKTTSDKYYTNEGSYRNPAQDSPWDLVAEAGYETIVLDSWSAFAKHYQAIANEGLNNAKPEPVGTLEKHDNREYVHTGMGLFPAGNDAKQELAELKRRIVEVQTDLHGLRENEQFLAKKAYDKIDETWHYASKNAYHMSLRLVQKHLIDIKV
jgi:hypothetical protein